MAKDPVFGEKRKPVAINRYSHVINEPLRFVRMVAQDPGVETEEEADKAAGQIVERDKPPEEEQQDDMQDLVDGPSIEDLINLDDTADHYEGQPEPDKI